MGTILCFHTASVGKHRPLIRERRKSGVFSAEVIVFPGVRIERHDTSTATGVALDGRLKASDSAGQTSNH